MNNWTGLGRLTAEPDLRFSQSGVAICKFTLAINRKFKRDETDFIPIVVFNKTAENAAQYLTKGSQCAVEGRIQTRNYEGQDGRKVYVTEILADTVEFIGSKGSGKQDSSPAPRDEWEGIGETVGTDSDVPF